MMMHGWIVLWPTSILTDLSQVNLKGIPIPTTFSRALSVVWSAAILCPNIPRKDVNIWTNFLLGDYTHSSAFSINQVSAQWLFSNHPRHPNEDPPTANQQGPVCNLAKMLTPTSLGYEMSLEIESITLPETNILPLKISGHPKMKLVFQPSICRGYVSFREVIKNV